MVDVRIIEISQLAEMYFSKQIRLNKISEERFLTLIKRINK